MRPQEKNQNNKDANIKDIIIQNVINPLISGLAFGLVWLGTFHLLKKKIMRD
jgi:hypothetical protein